jgi:hypothetical protein
MTEPAKTQTTPPADPPPDPKDLERQLAGLGSAPKLDDLLGEEEAAAMAEPDDPAAVAEDPPPAAPGPSAQPPATPPQQPPADPPATQPPPAAAQQPPAADTPPVEPPQPPPVTLIPVFKPLPLIPAQQIEQLKTEAAAERKRYEDGEVTFDDYMAKVRALDGAEMQNRMASMTNQANRTAMWEAEQRAFLGAHKELSNPAVHDLFVTRVNQLIEHPDAAKVTDRQLLEEAYKVVLELRGAFGTPTPPKPSAEELARQAKQQRAEGDARRAAMNIGDLPAAGTNDDSAGLFASLDKLDGDALEAALARMPAEAVERYLAS